MGEAAALRRIDYAEYLALERETDQKHEWFDGEAYAMAGGTLEHGSLSAAMVGELRALAMACGCQVFTSDAKLRVLETGLATYPDVSVVCGTIERDPEDHNAMTNPAVLVEVLSDGTEAYDRGEKFDHYRQIPSLRDYLLVSQHKRQIELYSRGERGRWELSVAGAGASLRLTAMGGAVEVDRVYAGISLAPPSSRAGAAR